MRIAGVIFLFCIFVVLHNNAFCQLMAGKKDTLFIGRDSLFAGRVIFDARYPEYREREVKYIIHNRHSRVYDLLPGFEQSNPGKYHDVDSFDYNPLCHRKDLIRHRLYGLPQNWYGLKYYRGEYYTYIAGEVRQFQINPYVMNEYFMDDPGAPKILSVKKISPEFYTIRSVRCSGGDTTTMNIYIIDKKRKVAIFEQTYYDDEAYRYMLMVAAREVRSFPAIVNLPKGRRATDFRGDKIPFKELVDKVKKNIM